MMCIRNCNKVGSLTVIGLWDIEDPYMSGPMGKPPLWKNYIFIDKRRIFY